ncbi:nicotinate-nucleotide--dimethylbenzimidazole phosphoribosyltransferase [Mesorhizobium microcysteis]|uniref:Nicotinate-nucleotide--dimethylbenzimidazole phosphoribosyltransferase n=1 Tax=Neoaquamicrobium microcysteis TaxID=2682781 RepID=A0A5D4GXU0_9HYPH|nr:nicotinate-nucleotide--dimethylbenzimidazole phosphoribosyltransferase [Mesorhizobium microcysteis]TYR33681.1 nicotinate-nucleotide--dimethylbenzimidazole phosphoribosyltransferase [Mesorhizobium microcysteis]
MTTGLPFDDYRQLLKTLPGPSEAARARAANRNARFSAQGPALGRLGETAEWLAAWTGRDPQVLRPLVALYAGTHGLTRHGVTPRGKGETQAMIEHAAAGGAAVNQLCAANDLGLKIFDLALHLPVGDIASEPALDERGCAATMAFGMEAVAGGIDLVCVGAVGAGGTTSAAALMTALLGGEAAEWVGPGSGADTHMMSRKIETVEKALALHGAHLKDPLEALRRLGGREFAAIAGTILAARVEKVPVILDGYAALAAAAVLRAAEPTAIDHCLLAHASTEPGVAKAAAAMGMRPLLDLSLGDGEGLGAALAAGVVKNAALVHAGMAIRE